MNNKVNASAKSTRLAKNLKCIAAISLVTLLVLLPVSSSISLVGEALDSEAAFHFENGQVELSITNLVYGGPSLQIKGREKGKE